MSGYYWLASYPKSGNTWLRMFLDSLALGGASPDINSPGIDNAATRDRFDRILDIESSDLTDDEIACARPRMYELEADAAPRPLLRKVHDAWGLTPAGEPLLPVGLTLGALYIVRDPRDVAVSLAHHMNDTIDKSIALMANPAGTMATSEKRLLRQLPQRLTTWSAHVESWLAAPVRILLLKYEDMLSDPIARFGEASRFLGFDASMEAITSAVEATGFERLRAQENTHGFAEAPPGMARFFRRGVAGGWRDTLTEQQVARIEADHGAMMRKLGYLPA
ncbi:MAG TPA: sulfotransferase domain-containing protein [Rhodocyclaceae bacterium]|nr:sulfotransferase domain-containing protein [Rhodocyclaceae bacterium]